MHACAGLKSLGCPCIPKVHFTTWLPELTMPFLESKPYSRPCTTDVVLQLKKALMDHLHPLVTNAILPCISCVALTNGPGQGCALNGACCIQMAL